MKRVLLLNYWWLHWEGYECSELCYFSGLNWQHRSGQSLGCQHNENCLKFRLKNQELIELDFDIKLYFIKTQGNYIVVLKKTQVRNNREKKMKYFTYFE